MNNYFVIDAETTTHNKGHFFDPRNQLVSFAYTGPSVGTVFRYYTDPGFRGSLLLPPHVDTVVGFNFKFDLHWLKQYLPTNVKVWDCQLAEHIFTGQKGQYISLNECLEKYGLETKIDTVKELWESGVQTTDISVATLEEYNVWDVKQEEQLFLVQQQLLSDEQKALVYLLGEDLKVLRHVEDSGLLFDSSGAEQALLQYKADVQEIEKQLNARLPTIHFGTFNWDSGDHLSCFLYGGTLAFDYAIPSQAIYKSGPNKGQSYTKNSWHTELVVFNQLFKPLEGTELSKTKESKDPNCVRLYQTDAPTLSSLKGKKENLDVLDLLKKRSQVQKVVEMLESVFKLFDKNQWEHNLIHGQYNQNVAITGRLSSSAPNMQNFPPELERFIVTRYR